MRYRYGAGAFKVEYALSGPIPWRAPECRLAGTVHLGGALWEIVASEAAVARGQHPQRPYVLLAQQSIVDSSRAPEGKHTAWAYCHVPNGSHVDMTDRIEAQIERFAPGFRDLVLARQATTVQELEAYNANYIGGDISGGAAGGSQLVLRPVPSLNPYRAAKGIYICSASTPPGAGVHGMCGYWAARAALRTTSNEGCCAVLAPWPAVAFTRASTSMTIHASGSTETVTIVIEPHNAAGTWHNSRRRGRRVVIIRYKDVRRCPHETCR